MKAFSQILDQHFPGALPDADYAARTAALLHPFGFSAENAIACVATCRDEICRPVRVALHEQWGEAFNLSSLGGMLTLGRTGFQAFHAHAPQTYARRRHIYYAMPHLGIDADGVIGEATRHGIPQGSKACGALFAFADELAAGRIDVALDLEDIEQSLLKSRLIGRLTWGETPEPIPLVKLAAEAILEELEAGIDATVDPAEVDYAVFTAVQIHGPDGGDYIAPLTSYAVVEGNRHELSLAA